MLAIEAPARRLLDAYARRGHPLLPLTRWARRPLRWYFHRRPTLRHDSRFYWRPKLLLGLHRLLVRDHPQDFTIHGGQVRFRSSGSAMSVQGYYVGEIEHHLLRFVLSRLGPGFSMIDVGAHHGLFGVVVAHELRRRGLGGRVHCFEPDPRNFALCEHNVRQNGLEELVTLHQEAVGDAEGTQRLLRSAEENSDNALAGGGGPGPAGRLAESKEVAVVALDGLRSSIGSVDLIKIDVQGAEPLVLSGAAEVLRRDRPVVVVEAVAGWPSSEQTRGLLEAAGYRLHGLDRQGALCPLGSKRVFVSWDWVGLPENR